MLAAMPEMGSASELVMDSVVLDSAVASSVMDLVVGGIVILINVTTGWFETLSKKVSSH